MHLVVLYKIETSYLSVHRTLVLANKFVANTIVFNMLEDNLFKPNTIVFTCSMTTYVRDHKNCPGLLVV